MTDQGGFEGEGVHLVRVRRLPTPAPGDATLLRRARTLRRLAPPRVTADARWIGDSVRRVTVGGREQLVADARVTTDTFGRVRATDRVIARGRLRSGPAALERRLRLDDAGRTLRATLPVFSTPVLDIRTRSGRRLTVRTASTAPVVVFEDPVADAEGVPADPGAAAAALGARGGRLPGARLAQRWRLTATPAYAGVREGLATLDEDTPTGEALTEILANDADRRRQVFGSARPLPTRWSFRAVDALTGAAVRVRLDQAAGRDAIGVRRARGRARRRSPRSPSPPGESTA